MVTPCRIELFGGLRVVRKSYQISKFQTQKTGAMVAMLAIEPGKKLSREHIATTLWREGEGRAIRNRLNQAVSSVRRQIHLPGDEAGLIIQANHNYVWFADGTVHTDLQEFDRLLEGGEPHLDRLQALELALDLYRGPVMDGYSEEWLLQHRLNYELKFSTVLRELITIKSQSGKWESALTNAERLVALDSLDDSAHVLLMQCQLATGRHRAVVKQFDLMKASLKSLGVEPSETAHELVQSALEPAPSIILPATEPMTPAPNADLVASGPAQPHLQMGRLPQFLNKLIGRDEMVQEIGDRFESGARLVTLSGMGGFGKTRLAVEVARKWNEKERYASFASLTDLTTTDGVFQAARSAFSTFSAEGNPLEEIRDLAAAQSEPLLILDNADGGEEVCKAIDTLLATIPDLRLLLTTRGPLEIEGELVIPVKPLECPSEKIEDDLIALANVPSVALFAARAQQVRSDFQITKRIAAPLAALSRRLEGIPLSIELAAGWARTLSPAAMVEQIDHRLDLLSTRRKDISDRHRSMRATIESSYVLLEEQLQDFFLRLCLLDGKLDLRDARGIVPDIAAGWALRILEERSFLFTSSNTDTGTFGILDTLRDFAHEKITPEAANSAKKAIVDYYHSIVRRLASGSATDTNFYAEIHRQYPNYIAAMRYAEEAGEHEKAICLAARLSGYWLVSERLQFAKETLSRLLNSANDVDSELIAVCKLRLAAVLWALNEHKASKKCIEETLSSIELKDVNSIVLEANHLLAVQAHQSGEYERALDLQRECVRMATELGDQQMVARCCLGVGNAMMELEDRAGCQEWYERSLGVARDLQDRGRISAALVNLGYMHLMSGEYDAARLVLEEAYRLASAAALSTHVANACVTLIRVERSCGNLPEALRWVSRFRNNNVQSGYLRRQSMLECAAIFALQGAHVHAAEAFGRVDGASYRAQSPVYSVENKEHSAIREEVRKFLGDETFSAAVAVGTSKTDQEIYGSLLNADTTLAG